MKSAINMATHKCFGMPGLAPNNEAITAELLAPGDVHAFHSLNLFRLRWLAIVGIPNRSLSFSACIWPSPTFAIVRSILVWNASRLSTCEGVKTLAPRSNSKMDLMYTV